MRARTILGAFAVGLLVWWAWPEHGARSTAHEATALARAVGAAPGAIARAAMAPEEPRETQAPASAEAGTVTLSGRVVDETTGDGIAGAEVLARGALGEASATSGPGGAFAVAVAPGMYRLAVRGGGGVSVGLDDRERLPGAPQAASVALPVERAMPEVAATADVSGIELPVAREATIAGTVVDGDGRAVAHAIVRARGGVLRPLLGTDVAETDDRGAFELHVPAGRYRLDAAHRDYAGPARPVLLEADAGAPAQAQLELARGCIIEGRVVRADGTPGEGAIERRAGADDDSFAPAGRSEPDGSFRFTTLATGDVVVRAWPWKSAPSPARAFACRDGAHFTGVELRVPDAPPAIEGTVVDATGAPVPLAYLDVIALDPDAPSQEERADASGHFAVYDLPAGRYRITSSAPGLGFATTTVTAPQAGVALALAGTGRIAGTVRGLTSGSVELAFESCGGAGSRAAVAREPRLVTVTDGRFVVDGAPACDLVLLARWHGRFVGARTIVTAGQTAAVTLDLADPQ